MKQQRPETEWLVYGLACLGVILWGSMLRLLASSPGWLGLSPAEPFQEVTPTATLLSVIPIPMLIASLAAPFVLLRGLPKLASHFAFWSVVTWIVFVFGPAMLLV